MQKRTTLSVFAFVIATLAMCLPALADETNMSVAEQPGPEQQAPQKTAAQPVAPRPVAADDPYRCHPSEDISCTVVRETTQGTLIVTRRPPRRSGRAPAWIVINAAPPSPGPHPGGTVYVVPNATPDVESVPHQVAWTTPNGAPIID
jgi:hypothetical protein